MSNEQAFIPTESWPLQETYKRRLHESIQQWGESILPVLYEADDESRADKESFFQFLMESVTRGDAATANLIQTLQDAMLESTRSWYTNQLGSLDKGAETRKIQQDFDTLYKIYLVGKLHATA